jgi:hypothetical protein
LIRTLLRVCLPSLFPVARFACAFLGIILSPSVDDHGAAVDAFAPKRV